MLLRTMNQFTGNININLLKLFPGNFRKSSDLKEKKSEDILSFPLRGRQSNAKLSLLTSFDKKSTQAKKLSKSKIKQT
jgi:hypothetical protein